MDQKVTTSFTTRAVCKRPRLKDSGFYIGFLKETHWLKLAKGFFSIQKTSFFNDIFVLIWLTFLVWL